MESKAYALWTGAFVLLILLALVLMSVWMSGRGGPQPVGYMMSSTQSVTGLNKEAQVLFRGIPVGRISEMRLDPVDHRVVRIRADLSPDLHLSRATYAKLASQGITGMMFVELFDEGGADRLDPARDVIELRPSILQEVGNSIPEAMFELRRLGSRLNDVLDADNRKNLAGLIANLNTLSAELPAASREAQATLREAHELAVRLQTLSRQTGDSMIRLQESVGQSARQVGGAAAQLGEMAGQVNARLAPQAADTLEQLRRTTQSLDALLEQQRREPQSLLFGREAATPGPGEAGFDAQGALR